MPTPWRRAIRIDRSDLARDRDAIRIDRGELPDLARAVRTPEGYVIAEGRIARVGVLKYVDRQTGQTRAELVPAEELFAPAAMASLNHRPMTLHHPGERVTARTFRRDGVGHTAGARAEGRYLVADCAIMRQDAIDAARGGVRYLSTARYQNFDPTPGVYVDPDTGERIPYDGVQRDIRFVETALTDDPRGGNTLAIRLDSRYDSSVREPTPPKESPMALSAALLLALSPLGVAAADPDDVVATKVGTFVGDLSAARARAATLDQEAARLRQDANDKSAGDHAKMIAFAKTRHGLLTKAEAAGLRLDSNLTDTGTNEAIAEAIVVALDDKAPRGKSADYYGARLDSFAADGRFDAGSASGGAYKRGAGPTDPQDDPRRPQGRDVREDRRDQEPVLSSSAASRKGLEASRSVNRTG